ncbi:MAG: hypothetical protein HQ465_08590 [Rhodospirillales bacterium]|nr:hypothetical protein [Rhodospirillales bacterium]
MRSSRLVLSLTLLGLVLLSVATGGPARADMPRISAQSMERVIAAARAYGEDRSLILYCLRDDPSDLATAHAGMKTDLAEAVDRLRASGGNAEQAAQMMRATLDRVRPTAPGRIEPAMDAKCAGRDFERELADGTGAALPLVQRPPFETGGL